MCGIVAYVGPREAQEFILEGLRRLEYRGYDSAGIAVLNAQREFHIVKVAGRITSLAKKLDEEQCQANIGIGHTRWATHGKATINNAHPHLGGQRGLSLAHNGVIENYSELKIKLERKGYAFVSETDTEVVAHLIDDSLKRLRSRGHRSDGHALGVEAIKDAIAQLRGTYGLVVLFREWPDAVFCARLGSPLVIGIGDNEQFVASDPSPLVGYTDRIVYLADHQVAVVTADAVEVAHRDRGVIEHDVCELDVDHRQVELGGYDHYMLKEIFEQPESLMNTLRGRLNDDDATAVFGGLNLEPHKLRRIKRILLMACGSSWHAALVGEYMLEEIAQIPVEVEYASELRYRNSQIDDSTLVFAITQSGETADTLGALKEMKRKGHLTLAICNVVGSSIAQEAGGGIYLHAGPEIGVASTKAYTSQCLAFAMLALLFGRLRHLGYSHGREMIDQIRRLPDLVRAALQTNDTVRQIAEKYYQCNNFLYLGRHYNFPTALEGALKLKEISYVHAEGYPAAEMKHGPIALVDAHTPSVFVMPTGFIYDKVMSNLEEIKSRGGPVVAVAAAGDQRIERVADDVVFIPDTPDFLQPIVSIIPLQMLAYHIAILRGCDVDKPRNLAKSVTVE